MLTKEKNYEKICKFNFNGTYAFNRADRFCSTRICGGRT